MILPAPARYTCIGIQRLSKSDKAPCEQGALKYVEINTAIGRHSLQAVTVCSQGPLRFSGVISEFTGVVGAGSA